jgi:broad specificity phosphatase PhoE
MAKEKERERERESESKKELAKEELHPPETITNILLIRHGHTEATELGLLYSDATMPLTAKGMEQAKHAAKWAAHFKPEVILTGKALRVVQAAEPLAHVTGIKPTVIKGFEEWRVGKWEGRTYLDIKKNDPAQYEAWSADPVNNAPPEGESIDDLNQRIGKSLRQLIMSDEYCGKKIAMVTHSGIIRSIIVQALDMPVSNFWRIAVPTGSVSRVNFSKNFAILQFSGLVPDVHFKG